MFVCSVILVNHPFETDFAGKRLFLQKNDVLLTDDVSKSLFLHHPGNVTELRIDECIVRKYLESADRIQYSDTPVPVPFIKTSFTLLSLLHDIVINLSRHNTLPQQFSEQMFLPAFPFSPRTEVSCLCYSNVSIRLHLKSGILSVPVHHGHGKLKISAMPFT